jgi:hypothetical protein
MWLFADADDHLKATSDEIPPGVPKRRKTVKKKEPTIRLSSRNCVVPACGKKGFHLTSAPNEFSAPVCPEHLIGKLREWEADEKPKEKPNAPLTS